VSDASSVSCPNSTMRLRLECAETRRGDAVAFLCRDTPFQPPCSTCQSTLMKGSKTGHRTAKRYHSRRYCRESRHLGYPLTRPRRAHVSRRSRDSWSKDMWADRCHGYPCGSRRRWFCSIRTDRPPRDCRRLWLCSRRRTRSGPKFLARICMRYLQIGGFCLQSIRRGRRQLHSASSLLPPSLIPRSTLRSVPP